MKQGKRLLRILYGPRTPLGFLEKISSHTAVALGVSESSRTFMHESGHQLFGGGLFLTRMGKEERPWTWFLAKAGA